MLEPLKLAGQIAVIILVLVGFYLFLAVPGFILLRVHRRFKFASVVANEITTAILRAVFFAPVIIWGHNPILAPAYLAAVVYFSAPTEVKLTDALWLLIASLVVFVGSLVWGRRRSALNEKERKGAF